MATGVNVATGAEVATGAQVATGARLVEHDVGLHGGKGDGDGEPEVGGVRHDHERRCHGVDDQHAHRLRPGEGEWSVHKLPARTRTGVF